MDNPIRLIDPDGMEVIGHKKKDAEKAKADVLNMFKSDKFSNFRKLISLDGKKFASIDQKALSKALDGVKLSPEEKTLINTVTTSINSKSVHEVEYVGVNDNVSAEGSKAIVDHLNKGGENQGDDIVKANDGLVTGQQVNTFLGGGATTVETDGGSYSVIVDHDGESADQQSVTTGHEVFGHGIPFANGAGPEQNNTNAVQTDNLIRKVLGMPPMDPNAVQRHVGATNPTALPSMVDKQ